MNYKIKKIDIFLLLFLVVIIATTILCLLYPKFGEYFLIKRWFGSETLSNVPIWVVILFVMIVCFLGALIPFPIPYALPITLFAAAWFNELGLVAFVLIVILIFLASLSNTIGDLIDYLVGKGAHYVMSKDEPELKDIWSKIILSKPKAIPAVILIFGLTPLPDSLLMVPLGIAEYNIKKAFIWMFISRSIMFSFYAIAGLVAVTWILEGEDPFGWVFGIVMLYVMWLIITIMVKYKPKAKKVSKIETKVIENEQISS